MNRNNYGYALYPVKFEFAIEQLAHVNHSEGYVLKSVVDYEVYKTDFGDNLLKISIELVQHSECGKTVISEAAQVYFINGTPPHNLIYTKILELEKALVKVNKLEGDDLMDVASNILFGKPIQAYLPIINLILSEIFILKTY